jgi:hypothetical protein
MSEEIPRENPPLSAAELAAAAKLTDTDFEIIDAAILANCSNQWLKVARIMCDTEKALTSRYRDLSYVYYAKRLSELVKKGCLESQGNVFCMRFSEVRTPVSE